MITVTNLTHTAARVQYLFEHKRIRIEEICDPEKILHIDSKGLDEAESQDEPAELLVEPGAEEEKDEEASEDVAEENGDAPKKKLTKKCEPCGDLGENGHTSARSSAEEPSAWNVIVRN